MGSQYGVGFPWEMRLDQAGIYPGQEKKGFGTDWCAWEAN
jgi:hypothetical protein